MFAIHGFMGGTWVAQIPWAQTELHVSNTEIGFALLFNAMGALIAMPLVGQALTRIPSRRLVRVAALTWTLTLPLPLLAPSALALAAALLLFGALAGSLDVAMNAHGIGVERAMGRPIFSSLHGFWSVGSLGGASVVAVATGLGVDPRVEALAVAAGLWLLAFVATSRIGDVARPADAITTRIVLPSRAVLPLGLLVFAVLIVEGGVGDWSGIYLRRTLGAGPELGAAAYAAYALGITIGRLGGDELNRRMGAGRLLQVGMALLAIALGILLVFGQPIIAIVGLVVVGVGVGNAIPLLFRAGGLVPPAGPSLSAVFTMGYAGFVAGPPILGFLADRLGLPVALGLLAIISALVALVVRRAPGVETEPGRETLHETIAPSVP